MFHVAEITRIVDGELLRGIVDQEPARIWHDSRSIRAGDLFVALPGARVDGHSFLAQAYASGACAALVSDPIQAPDHASNLIVVPDPLHALHRLASAWRRQQSAPIIGITGSNGKTTVKRLLAHLLAGSQRTYVAPKNFNTEIGLPISILGMPDEAEAGVFELGTEAPGEISVLSQILRPSMAILTGIGPSHFETFGSFDAVADEKWTLVESLPAEAVALINADAPELRTRSKDSPARCLTVGFGHGEIRGRILQSVPRLAVEAHGRRIECGLLGEHNAANLLLAATAARRLNVAADLIAAQAAAFAPADHRLCPIQAPFGTILDDTYNANPASTSGALRVLAEWGNPKTRRIFVFGEMLDLGPESAAFHDEIASLARDLGIDAIVPVGDQPQAACLRQAPGLIQAGDAETVLRSLLEEGANNAILVKGSRALGLEDLVDALASPG